MDCILLSSTGEYFTNKLKSLTLSCSANERTEMKLKISEAWMCSEFGMLITDVEQERVKRLVFYK